MRKIPVFLPADIGKFAIHFPNLITPNPQETMSYPYFHLNGVRHKLAHADDFDLEAMRAISAARNGPILEAHVSAPLSDEADATPDRPPIRVEIHYQFYRAELSRELANRERDQLSSATSPAQGTPQAPKKNSRL